MFLQPNASLPRLVLDGITWTFPVTQLELGDATGLSVVHVNRTVMRLREAKFIAIKGEVFTILDREGLVEAGDFVPAYLHLSKAV